MHLKGRCWFAMKAALEAVHTAVEQRVPLTEAGMETFQFVAVLVVPQAVVREIRCVHKRAWGRAASAVIRDASRTRALEAPGHRTPEQRAIAACQK